MVFDSCPYTKFKDLDGRTIRVELAKDNTRPREGGMGGGNLRRLNFLNVKAAPMFAMIGCVALARVQAVGLSIPRATVMATVGAIVGVSTAVTIVGATTAVMTVAGTTAGTTVAATSVGTTGVATSVGTTGVGATIAAMTATAVVTVVRAVCYALEHFANRSVGC